MYHFRKYLTRRQILTFPNFLSLFRLILIPVFLVLFRRGHGHLAAGLVLLSALTDILDGVIARKFDMVSDLGKMLDPFCDKLTHGALLICLLGTYRRVWLLLVLLAVKELTMLVLGGIAVKRQEIVHSAKWYGKLSTVTFETAMLILMVFPDLPERGVTVLLALCAVALVFSFTMYVIFFSKQIYREK